jgi:hypothetical protein
MGNYDTLHLYALDHLSCLAMATQCKRVFSAARRILTPERNTLGLKVLETCECLTVVVVVVEELGGDGGSDKVSYSPNSSDRSPAYYCFIG